MRGLGCAGVLLLAGCQLVSGIASYSVSESSEGGSPGSGGSGGSGGGGGSAVDEMCHAYCDLATTQQGYECVVGACDDEACTELVFLDIYPGCEEEVLAYTGCLIDPLAFTCYLGFVFRDSEACKAEEDAWIRCMGNATVPSNMQDCDAACAGPFEPCYAGMAQCVGACRTQSQFGNCSGLVAGLVNCAAEHPGETWACGSPPTPGLDNSCSILGQIYNACLPLD